MSTTDESSSVELVGVGHQADLLEELVDGLELVGGADQLGQVLEPALGLDRVLGLELGDVAAAVEQRLEHRAGPVGHQRRPTPSSSSRNASMPLDGPAADARLVGAGAAPR